MARILLAEESPAERALARKTLLAAGHEIVEATSAAAALERVIAEPFDVIVLDTALPDATPEEVVDAIRNNAEHALTPIVQTISDREPEEARRRWLRRAEPPVVRSALGDFAIERLSKPFAPHQLNEAIARALRFRDDLGKTEGNIDQRARAFEEITSMQAEARANRRRW